MDPACFVLGWCIGLALAAALAVFLHREGA